MCITLLKICYEHHIPVQEHCTLSKADCHCMLKQFSELSLIYFLAFYPTYVKLGFRDKLTNAN